MYSKNFLLIFLFLGVKSVSSQLQEGEDCTLKDGQVGLCMQRKTCNRNVGWESLSEPCGFKGQTQLFCCQRSIARSLEACANYSAEIQQWHTYEEKINNFRKYWIIGYGVIAQRHELQYMVALWYEKLSGSGSHYHCGGSLISEYFVLTAAHCVGNDKPSKIRVGDKDLISEHDDSHAAFYEIADTIIHPRYNPKHSIYNDIALLKTSKQVLLSFYAQPLCIMNSQLMDEIIDLMSTGGWGNIEFEGDSLNTSSHPLRKAVMQYLDMQLCNEHYNKYPSYLKEKFPNGIIPSQICAKPLNSASTCRGDSGGPIERKFGVVSYVIGVTSFSGLCGGDEPQVFTNVAFFAPWIDMMVWPE